MSSSDRLSKCIWLVETIRRRGPITRSRLSRIWLESPVSNGEPLSRRSFYNYRSSIEEMFNVIIACNPATYEYSINEENKAPGNDSVANWVLNAMATNETLVSAKDVSNRIFVENVPSARQFLDIVIQSMRSHRKILIDYHPFTRSLPTKNIIVEPYFLKIFKQRWYMTGFVGADGKVKTYALDRVLKASLLEDTFEDNPAFIPEEYFKYSFGIMFTGNEPKRIILRVEPRQAKYFRALPLHHTQEEKIHDKFSDFYYTMRLSQDLVEEILSHGPRVTVIQPKELKLMVEKELRQALDNYQTSAPYTE